MHTARQLIEKGENVMKPMKQSIALMAMMALFIAVMSFTAQAQGRGGQSKGRTTTAGQGGGQTTGQVGRPSGQPGKQSGHGQMDQDRLRAHTTDQQRDRLRDCVSAADQARQRARDMTRDAKSAGYTIEQAAQQRDQLRQRFHAMQKQHEQFSIAR
jgi:hypothetical protein